MLNKISPILSDFWESNLDEMDAVDDFFALFDIGGQMEKQETKDEKEECSLFDLLKPYFGEGVLTKTLVIKNKIKLI